MRVLFASQDPGGADALLPVMRALTAKHHQVKWIASGASQSTLEREGVRFIPATVAETKAIMNVFESFGPDVVITGTSCGSSVDKATISIATRLKIRTIAVVDYWSYYKLRFQDPTGERFIPDTICVVDRRMKEEMVKAGYREKQIVITGNPRFDTFRSTARRTRKRQPATVLFLSQPFTEISDLNLGIGYTELDALRDIASVLIRINRTAPDHYHLIVRPHPKERLAKYTSLPTTPSLRISLDRTRQVEETMGQVRLIIGMSSVALLEAALRGYPVLSYQPNMKKELNILSKLGLQVTITTRTGLARALRVALIEGTLPKISTTLMRQYTTGRATEHVIACVLNR
jgi:hypothetical protein